MNDPILEYRLKQLEERIGDDRFLKNQGSGNEIGFWIFDYPAKKELQVREYLYFLFKKLDKKYTYKTLNIFQVIIDMLEERKLFDRICQREPELGLEILKKHLAAPLSQKKIAEYIARTIDLPAQQFVILTGLGNAWPLVRGHELMSALQDVMGFTPLLMFYPGTYSGYDLSPLAGINSRNYYRAFRLVPETGPAATLTPR